MNCDLRHWCVGPFLVAVLSAEIPGRQRLAAGDDILTPLDVRQVHVTGEMGRRIDVTIKNNLLALDAENAFLAPFRRKASTAPGDYIGLGKLIDSAVRFAAYTKDPKVIACKTHLVRQTIQNQQSDGYIGQMAVSDRLWKLWDIHEMSYIVFALTNDYCYFGEQDSLNAARKAADYILAHWPEKPADYPSNPHLVLHLATIGLDRAMLTLYRAARDQRYLDFCTRQRALAKWDPSIVLGRWGPLEGHVYAYLAECLTQLELYRLHPDDALLRPTRRAMHFITAEDGWTITGTVGKSEAWSNDQSLEGEVGETCATAYQLRVYDSLLRLTGSSHCGDLMERTIFNALFAAQSPDGRQLRYFTPAKGPRTYFSMDTYCCPNNFRRIVSELPQMIYFRSADGGAMINLYTASTANVPIAGDLSVQLRQETDYPNSGKVVVHVAPSRSAEFPLKLRIPRWCESATVSVNGRPTDASTKPGELCSLKREWRAGDVVTLDIPMKPRLVRGRKLQAGRVAVMRGPVVFCFSAARQTARYRVYAGDGANHAEIQRTVDEAIAQTKFDWTTLAAPIPDATVRPDGLAQEVRAWGPASDRSKPADLTLLLTEFVDPTGQRTYLPTDNPKTGVEDELCAGPAAK